MRKLTKKSIKIGILGGTFDPPHKGHLHISKIALRKLKLNKLICAITKKNHIINHFTGIGPSFYGYTKSIRIINTLLIPIYKILFNKITTKNIFHNISDKEKFMLLNF